MARGGGRGWCHGWHQAALGVRRSRAAPGSPTPIPDSPKALEACPAAFADLAPASPSSSWEQATCLGFSLLSTRPGLAGGWQQAGASLTSSLWPGKDGGRRKRGEGGGSQAPVPYFPSYRQPQASGWKSKTRWDHVRGCTQKTPLGDEGKVQSRGEGYGRLRASGLLHGSATLEKRLTLSGLSLPILVHWTAITKNHKPGSL